VGKYSGVSSELFHRKKSKASNRLIWDLMKIRLQNLRFQNIIRSVVTSCSSWISMAVYRSLRFPNPNSMWLDSYEESIRRCYKSKFQIIWCTNEGATICISFLSEERLKVVGFGQLGITHLGRSKLSEIKCIGEKY